MNLSDFYHLAQLQGVPVQAGTPFFNPKNPMQPFDFIDVFYFGTTMHKIKRLYSYVHAHTHTQCKFPLKCHFFRCQPVPAVFIPDAINLLLVVPYGCKMNAWNMKFGNHCLALRLTRCPTLAMFAGFRLAREPGRCGKLIQLLIEAVGLFSTQGLKIKRDNSKFTKRSCWHLLVNAHQALRLHI